VNGLTLYPPVATQRDQWVLDRRPARNKVDPHRPYAFLTEQERSHTGEVVSVATILLTNRECPWRCVMCDLWKNTLIEATPLGVIPEQIEYALTRLPPARQVKLYNSGSFFDRGAIPPSDYPYVAALVEQHDRVIVESHPSLVSNLTIEFRDLVNGQLEVAMGLETVHPEALEKINKKLTISLFATAASRLRKASVDLRVFVLVQPPFVRPNEALFWAQRSLDFAFECGATAVTLIPTRAGNGAMEELAAHGDFTPPQLSTVEASMTYGIGLQCGRVFVDLWDSARLQCCPECRDNRLERIHLINLSQRLTSPVNCLRCGGSS